MKCNIMGRKAQDGRGRLGGRKKGTPNKITGDLKSWVNDLLNNNRRQFETDLKDLLPMERVKILSGMFNYVIPKQSSISIEEQIETETQILTRFLSEAPDEAIDKIAERVLALQELNKQREEGSDE